VSDDTPTRTIAGHPATRVAVDVAGREIALWIVPDLERLVDRAALLRGDAEPPYWAHLWSGARVLASYLARGFLVVRGRRVLEVGCGLALPGLTAAVLGADVTLVDAEPATLAFAAASAEANAVACTTIASDFTRLDPASRWDVVLAAEIAYDRDRYSELAAVFERHLAPDGVALLADGYRTDTRGLYRALADAGCTTHAIDVRVDEEGRAIPVRLTVIRRREG
jgi:predicted nicotinamide N-methyase